MELEAQKKNHHVNAELLSALWPIKHSFLLNRILYFHVINACVGVSDNEASSFPCRYDYISGLFRFCGTVQLFRPSPESSTKDVSCCIDLQEEVSEASIYELSAGQEDDLRAIL